MFLKVPIIGKGTRVDPYRADVPAGIAACSAHIPTDKDGLPVFQDTVISMPDSLIVPSELVTKLLSESTARALVSKRDPLVVLEAMKWKPPVRDVEALSRYQLALETFQGSDTTDIGTTWDAGYAGGAVNLQRVSNKCRSTSTTLDAIESYNGVTFPNDQWAQYTIATLTGATILVPRVALRMAAPATVTFYDFQVLRSVPSRTSVLAKFVAGVFTELAFENVVSWAAGDRLRASAIGTALSFYRNGSTPALLTATDSAIAAGRAGLVMYAETLADCEISKWSAGGFGLTTLQTRHPMAPLLVR